MSYSNSYDKRPYVGVTDFTKRNQVQAVKPFVHKRSGRRLHVGAMMSYKTFHGIPTEKGWENIWLKPSALRRLFVKDPDVFNVLHWADYVSYPKTSAEDLIKACDLAGEGLSGLQLDMVWPHVHMIQAVKEVYPHLSIILQVSKVAIKDTRKRGISISSDLSRYNGCVDYVLIDYGMGEGTPLVPEKVIEVLREARKVFPETSLAIAGGLGPETFHLLSPILKEFPRISWDAQGRLRRSGSALDPIDMDRVKAYVRGSTYFAMQHMK
jgi:hypothetical protein